MEIINLVYKFYGDSNHKWYLFALKQNSCEFSLKHSYDLVSAFPGFFFGYDDVRYFNGINNFNEYLGSKLIKEDSGEKNFYLFFRNLGKDQYSKPNALYAQDAKFCIMCSEDEAVEIKKEYSQSSLVWFCKGYIYENIDDAITDIKKAKIDNDNYDMAKKKLENLLKL